MTSSKYKTRRGSPTKPHICHPPPPPPPPVAGTCDCYLAPAYQETDPWMNAIIEIYTHAPGLPDIAACGINCSADFGQLQGAPTSGVQDEHQWFDWFPNGQEGTCKITATCTWDGGLVCNIYCVVKSVSIPI